MNVIPRMTDPLGKYWDQPIDIREAPMDDFHVILTPKQMDQLSEYSSTYPTGVYDGKCWLRVEMADRITIRHRYLCWYGPSTERDVCKIHAREILVVRDE